MAPNASGGGQNNNTRIDMSVIGVNDAGNEAGGAEGGCLNTDSNQNEKRLFGQLTIHCISRFKLN